jgi:hypothetical protein
MTKPVSHTLIEEISQADVETGNQASEGWFIVAILIGSLVVIGTGGFGGIGLLQTHGLLLLPPWLSSAIGTIGNTFLWTMTVGGIVVGGGLITWGAYKIHLRRDLHRGIKETTETEEKEEKVVEQHDALTAQKEEKVVEQHDALSAQNELTLEFDKALDAPENRGSFKIHNSYQKLFHTQHFGDMGSAEVGDYCFINYKKGSPFKLLIIKDLDKDLCVLVRESTQLRGYFRLIQRNQSGNFQESILRFKAAQLAAMIRCASNSPQRGIRISTTTKIDIVRRSGLIIFTSEDEKDKMYYIFDEQGFLEPISISALNKMITEVIAKLDLYR